MKTHCSRILVLVLTLACGSLTSALAQDAVQHNPATSAAVGLVNAKSDLPPAGPRFSPWANEIVKLAKAGIEERVVLSFVENSGTFNLGADQIIHLTDAGVSSEVINAMLRHDAELASGARMLTTTTSPPLGPELERVLLAVRSASSEASQPSKVAAHSELTANQEPAQIAWTVFQPEASISGVKREGDESRPMIREASDVFAAKVPAAKASAAKTSSYRVPETRSVQLLPPIVVVNSANPPPNVIIIDMFPSSR